MSPLDTLRGTPMSRRVSFLDVGAGYRELRAEIDEAVQRVLDSGWYILGPEVEAFEREYAEYVGAKHCVGVGNGLEAMTLTLRAWGIGPGDEVIVPANTYIATWLAVTQVGAKLVPCELDPATYNLDPSRVERALSARTKVVMPVHLYGQAADLTSITQVLKGTGVRVLDDAAQGHGALHAGKRVGAIADATAWSFYPGKNLGALGDAGAVTTNDEALAESLRVLRNYGSRTKYQNDVAGFNSRMDPLQAAVLRAKLPHLDAWNDRRAAIAARYTQAFADLPWLTLPIVPSHSRPAWHLYVVRCRFRNELQEHLQALGVQTLIHYPIPPHRQQAYAGLGLTDDDYQHTLAIHDTILSLPLGPQLPSADVEHVIASVRSFAPPEPR